MSTYYLPSPSLFPLQQTQYKQQNYEHKIKTFQFNVLYKMNRQFPTYLLHVSLCSFSAYFSAKPVF